MEQTIYKSDVLVIGKGLAGVRAADAAVRSGARVIVANKASGSSPDVMGFNTTIGADDSVEDYIEDTMRSGGYINNRLLASRLAENSNSEITFLEDLGVSFDRNPDGGYNLMQTLGSSHKRMVHYQSLTGATALKLLLDDCRRRGVEFVEPVMILSLLKHDGRVVGASGLDLRGGGLIFFQSEAVVLATGGCGDIYPLTSYPKGITGDGYAMAFRAGAELVDMEFLQYDPCGFVTPPALRGRVMVTTLLNEGAELYNRDNERFVVEDYGTYNIQKSEIARRIYMEIRAGRGTLNGGVYYDMTKLPHDRVAIDHNLFYNPAHAAGIDLTKEPAEVAPLAHSCVGGLVIDRDCATTVEGLFAAGEVTGGVHGANRIGGSAGTEIFVFGCVAGNSAARYAAKWSGEPAQGLIEESAARERETFEGWRGQKGGASPGEMRERAAKAINNGIGIIRNGKGIGDCLRDLQNIEDELGSLDIETPGDLMDCYTLRNTLTVAKIQATASDMRKESRGVFYREDYPAEDDKWTRNIYTGLGGDGGASVRVADPVK
ncbi:MAG: FAD-binding protein [Synergistaceae bacterium]|jgi:succinate dehydrogenase/fumarate reductase flavoprotein subunit|nr:FAD-binding protein [Synergistaceae bacterium]